MKNVLLLASLFLCTSGIYAADSRPDNAVDGKQRNEAIYERMLVQTGWSHQKATPQRSPNAPGAAERTSKSSQPKSS